MKISRGTEQPDSWKLPEGRRALLYFHGSRALAGEAVYFKAQILDYPQAAASINAVHTQNPPPKIPLARQGY